MEQTWSRFRSLIKTDVSTPDGGGSLPQLGFKVTVSAAAKKLSVKVIGAKHLPASYGSAKPTGYLVKVTVFPGREKHETAIVNDSWPTFCEEFDFSLLEIKKKDDILNGKFISFTVYAILEPVIELHDAIRKKTSTLKRFFSLRDGDDENVEIRRNKHRSSFRHSFNNRRVVGAVTYRLERQEFVHRLRNDVTATADIWREINPIASGMLTEPREGVKGSVEVTLSYALSEDRCNDVVEISVTKFRCNLKTMQEHEKAHGSLYIKITATEDDETIQKMKSDSFQPTIALKIEHSTLRADVRKRNIEDLKILIRLICKNVLGQKTLLGKVEIDSRSEVWKEIVAVPAKSVTKMMNFS